MTRYAKRTDANHSDIRDGLRSLGYVVHDFSASGDGIFDLLVEVAPGIGGWLEVKDPKKPPSARRLTERERRFWDTCWRFAAKVETIGEAVQRIQLMRELAAKIEGEPA